MKLQFFINISFEKLFFEHLYINIVTNTREYFTHLISSVTNWKSLSDNLIGGSDTTTTLPTLP